MSYTMNGFRHAVMAAMGGSTTTAYTTATTTASTAASTASSTPYKVRVTANELNIRTGSGTSYSKNGSIKDKGVYTIIEEQSGWGRLKSGVVWVSLDYCKKI